jgi:hypothetical protein
MNRLWHSFATGLKKLRRCEKSKQASRRIRPTLESLERRDVLSTLFLVPTTTAVDATHFHSFQSAYQAANVGDTIQIEPGASASSIGAGVQGHRLAGGAINTSSITIDNTNIGAGEWVQINGGGGGGEDAFVTAVQQNSPTSETLFLYQPLQMDHTGSGATVVTMGELGIAKAITLQGDPNNAQAVVSSQLETPVNTSGIVFNNLDFSNPQGVLIDAGHQNIHIENSTLSFLQMGIGSGNANDIITNDTFTGSAVINGDSAGLTADHITNNHFIDSASLFMINNGDSVVSGNTFDVSQNGNPFTAITLVNCPNVLVYDNTVNIGNADSDTTGLFLWQTNFYPQSLTAYVENNVFNTAGKGVGLDTSGAVNAMVQGNDFRDNAVGVYLWGNGTTAGNVDLGGGSFGSLGQNNFSTFTSAGVANGYFAITMHNTAANDQVFAYNNIWNTIDPPNVIKDSYNNANANEAVYSGFQAGTGEILTVDIQMISWLRFVRLEALPRLSPYSLLSATHTPQPTVSYDPSSLDVVFTEPLTRPRFAL